MKYTPRQAEFNVNVTPTSPLREFFVLTAGLLGIVVAVYLLLGLAVDLIVPRLSMDLEQQMATPFIRSIEGKVGDSQQERSVQALIETLQDRCARLPYRFKIHVRQAPTINALAFPGGHIIIYTGLLNKVTSENRAGICSRS